MNINDRLDNLIRNGNANVGLNTMNGVECVNTGNGFIIRENDNNPTKPFIDNDIKYEKPDYEKLVDNIKLYSLESNNFKLDIAAGSICLELKRLIYKCNTFDNTDPIYQAPTTMYNNTYACGSVVVDQGMRVVESCIWNIVDKNNFNNKNYDTEYSCYRYILINTIQSLFDIYRIFHNDNYDRVFKFIDYFIKTFKPEK